MLLLVLNGINAGKLIIDYDENQKAVEEYIDLALYQNDIQELYQQRLLQKIQTFNTGVEFTCNGIPVNFHSMALALVFNRQNIVDVIMDDTSRQPFNPNFQDQNGNTFLHIFLALELSNFLIPFLEFNELKFDVANKKKVTPLMIAIVQKNYWWINTLLHEGAYKYRFDKSGKSVKKYMQEHLTTEEVNFYFPPKKRSISIVSPEHFLNRTLINAESSDY